MAFNSGARGHELAAAARDGLMQVVTQQQLAKSPDLQALVGNIGGQLAGALSGIQLGAAEARTVAPQVPAKGGREV